MNRFEELKIIYIAGSYRSGSTILDILLSQQHEIFGLGELINVFTSGWINNEYCSCGQKVQSCSFWNSVKEAWEKNSNFSIQEYASMQFQCRRIYAWPYLIWKRIFQNKRFMHFKNDTKLLYEVISTISGCKVLIDSSKSASWLLTLQMMNLNPYILHIVRDGRKVLRSVKRPFKKNLEAGIQQDMAPKRAFKIAIQWVLTNLRIEFLKRKTISLLVKYEVLISNPQSVIQSIAQTFNVNLDEVQNVISQDRLLKKEHIIAGNRVRMETDLKFKKDRSSEGKAVEISKMETLYFNIVAYFFLKKYNYVS